MTKARRRRPNLPPPAPRPDLDLPPEDEHTRYEDAASPATSFNEPVFEDESEDAQFDRNERFEDLKGSSPSGRNSADLFNEPVFDAVWEEADRDESPPKAIAVGSSSSRGTLAAPQKSSAVALPVDPNDSSATATVVWNDADAPTAGRSRGRRLGNTTPFWLMGSGLILVLVLAVWLIFLRGGDEADRELTAAPGLVGSAAISQGAVEAEPVAEPTPEPDPTATAIPVFTAGQVVVVTNTAGAGIRLRSQPGTGSTVLDIYQEGDRFLVLNPDGEYSSYPVEADGYRWYRIQITGNPEENLTGWAAGDFLALGE
jgi:hypothetical protein